VIWTCGAGPEFAWGLVVWGERPCDDAPGPGAGSGTAAGGNMSLRKWVMVVSSSTPSASSLHGEQHNRHQASVRWAPLKSE
jgi:hypothetical protein